MKVSRAVAEKELAQFKKAILKRLKLKNADFSLFLVSNRVMDGIREKMSLRPDFKGREADKIRAEEAVSILSFPDTGFPHPESKKKELGEIYINYEFTKGDLDLLVFLLIHGLLHLLGYEHQTKRDTMDMEKLEKELFILVHSK